MTHFAYQVELYILPGTLEETEDLPDPGLLQDYFLNNFYLSFLFLFLKSASVLSYLWDKGESICGKCTKKKRQLVSQLFRRH